MYNSLLIKNKEAAKKLGWSERHMRRIAEELNIKKIQLGETIYYSLDDFKKLPKKQKKPRKSRGTTKGKGFHHKLK